MRNQKKAGVISALKAAVRSHRILTVSTLLCVAASVAASLIPPLLLKNIIDRLTGGMPLLFTAVLLYFGSLVLEGTLSSAQETLLVLFGQKMTHALRSEMSQKLIALPASTLVGQNPGCRPAYWYARTPGRWQPAFPAMWTRWKPCSLPASSAW